VPELPEVETIRRGVVELVEGQRLRSVEVLERIHLLKNCTEGQLKRRLEGRLLTDVGRRGKYLLFDFEGALLVLHLRMSGRLLIVPACHTRMVLSFEGGLALHFDDARRFGMAYLTRRRDLEALAPIGALGIEPLTPGYTREEFEALLARDQEIKRLLLDQHKLAGLGNIYANESLFEAGIHPLRAASGLRSSERTRLYRAIPAVLERAIAAGGTSMRSYQMPSGELGRFQENFSVYDRAGSPCPRCGTAIERLPQGGRSSYFCRKCQPMPPLSG
jgi:formamidopyrimidine-DNA glycosylase